MARRINAPGIEVNEIDRSSYEHTVDNSTIGTTTLVFGFADKGDDYTVRWINTMNTFVRTYGNPTNEAEKYFYNSVYEIINGGGVCYAAKLPYYNNSLDNFTYTSYTISPTAEDISSTSDIFDKTKGNVSIKDFMFSPWKIDSISQNVLSPDVTYEAKQLEEFIDYINEVCNFDVNSQEKLKNVIFKDPVDVRKSTRTLNEIIVGSYSKDGVTSEEITTIQSSILNAFGKNITADDIVDKFLSRSYLSDMKGHFVSMAQKYTAANMGDMSVYFDEKYTEIRVADDSITSYIDIQPDEQPNEETMSFENYDKFIIKELRVPLNKIYIVDKTRGKYDKDTFGNEILGIMPAIVSPVNAMFYQEVIRKTDAILPDYNVIEKVRNSYRENGGTAYKECLQPFDYTNRTVSSEKSGEEAKQFPGLVDCLGNEVFELDNSRVTINDFTTSEVAAEYFPTIKFINDRLDRKYLKQIGIVVFKVFKDTANEDKISSQPVESFVGSLDRKARDETTGERIFIDDIVNSNSDYITVFSNADIKESDDGNTHSIKNASIYKINNQTACSLGFYQRETRKLIHVSESIYAPLLKIFEKSEDRNTLDFDIIIDGGVSNIAQFIASTQLYKKNKDTGIQTSEYVKDEFKRFGTFDFNDETAYLFKLDSRNQCTVWRKVIDRFDDFVKNTRKDAMFIADGPRPFCLENNDPVVRRTKPDNTVKNSILPKMKLISGIFNSSYSAGYLNWFYSVDHSTGEYMWIPPSIKALGVYLYTDNNGSYWDAPAGLNRGKIKDTLNLAFNPTNEEAGQIYVNSWNYAVSYPLDGIVLEGQRTFQKEKTALDRVNVRRLMLGMEKVVRNLCKYFNYQGNTEYNRERIKDLVDRYLEQVRMNDGISQYITVCDERNNTEQTIENNELHISIAVRPIKTIEFIVLNFIATNQTTDVEEVMESELGT